MGWKLRKHNLRCSASFDLVSLLFRMSSEEFLFVLWNISVYEYVIRILNANKRYQVSRRFISIYAIIEGSYFVYIIVNMISRQCFNRHPFFVDFPAPRTWWSWLVIFSGPMVFLCWFRRRSSSILVLPLRRPWIVYRNSELGVEVSVFAYVYGILIAIRQKHAVSWIRTRVAAHDGWDRRPRWWVSGDGTEIYDAVIVLSGWVGELESFV